MVYDNRKYIRYTYEESEWTDLGEDIARILHEQTGLEIVLIRSARESCRFRKISSFDNDDWMDCEYNCYFQCSDITQLSKLKRVAGQLRRVFDLHTLEVNIEDFGPDFDFVVTIRGDDHRALWKRDNKYVPYSKDGVVVDWDDVLSGKPYWK